VGKETSGPRPRAAAEAIAQASEAHPKKRKILGTEKPTYAKASVGKEISGPRPRAAAEAIAQASEAPRKKEKYWN
jgi:hypothetical protein